jgi:hypothetical protein
MLMASLLSKDKHWQIGLKNKTQPIISYKKSTSLTKVNTNLK